MLLAVDIGNSQTKLGFFEGGQLCGGRRRIPTDPKLTVDAWTELLRESAKRRIGTQTPDDVAICSSAPAATPSLLAAIEPTFGIADPLVLGPDTDFGMEIHYDPPESVGRDRLANVLAARERDYGGIMPKGVAKVVVDLGTATTFDVLDASGGFAGGAIAPGLYTAATALLTSASHLPEFELARPRSPIGHTTVEALQSGIVLGHAHMVNSMIHKLGMTLDLEVAGYSTGQAAFCIATGGWVKLLSTLLPFVTTFDKDLTLYGIYYAWRLNRERE
jgi:type III pantothenate kinase